MQISFFLFFGYLERGRLTSDYHNSCKLYPLTPLYLLNIKVYKELT